MCYFLLIWTWNFEWQCRTVVQRENPSWTIFFLCYSCQYNHIRIVVVIIITIILVCCIHSAGNDDVWWISEGSSKVLCTCALRQGGKIQLFSRVYRWFLCVSIAGQGGKANLSVVWWWWWHLTSRIALMYNLVSC